MLRITPSSGTLVIFKPFSAQDPQKVLEAVGRGLEEAVEKEEPWTEEASDMIELWEPKIGQAQTWEELREATGGLNKDLLVVCQPAASFRYFGNIFFSEVR